ncbi:interferon regulatory factor 2-like [Porites lutea]|uniref:interferon regulatory factor 2-like n=1 Tax=Porites lutea TaxID=51062 RepID=UPI003CC58841
MSLDTFNAKVLHLRISKALILRMHQRIKLRLRDWLKELIDAGLYGLKWEGDPRKRTLRTPWKNCSRHGWSVKDDAALFRAWATYTGKNKEGRDLPDPRKWKTNFRCALNALPDIKEIREESCPRGKDAYKIYKMRPVRGRSRVFIPQSDVYLVYTEAI